MLYAYLVTYVTNCVKLNYTIINIWIICYHYTVNKLCDDGKSNK